MVRSRFREYEEETLRSPACCRQEHATFSSNIHGTWGPPFSPSLYGAVLTATYLCLRSSYLSNLFVRLDKLNRVVKGSVYVSERHPGTVA